MGDNMDEKLRRDIILDNYNNPLNKEIPTEDGYLKINSRNYSCIDNLDIYLKINNNIIVDDYAHHPSEVRTVIETARQKYPAKQVVVVLIPYTISRTKAFYKEFAEVLKLADKAFVTDIEPARERFSDYPGITSDLIINLVPNAEHISSDEISKLYKYDNAVIPFMGCKDPTWLIDAYKKGLDK